MVYTSNTDVSPAATASSLQAVQSYIQSIVGTIQSASDSNFQNAQSCVNLLQDLIQNITPVTSNSLREAAITNLPPRVPIPEPKFTPKLPNTSTTIQDNTNLATDLKNIALAGADNMVKTLDQQDRANYQVLKQLFNQLATTINSLK